MTATVALDGAGVVCGPLERLEPGLRREAYGRFAYAFEVKRKEVTLTAQPLDGGQQTKIGECDGGDPEGWNGLLSCLEELEVS